MSIDEYLTKMKMFADNLGIDGYLITDDDLMLHVLAGLRSEYDLVVVNLTSRIVPATWQEAQALLLNQESHIDQMNATTTLDLSNASANYVSNQKVGGNNGQNISGRGKGLGLNKFKGGWDRNGQGARGNSKPTCQFCNKVGDVPTLGSLACKGINKIYT